MGQEQSGRRKGLGAGEGVGASSAGSMPPIRDVASDPSLAWQNMVDAIDDGPFVEDLCKAVSNSGNTSDARRWLLTAGVNFLRTNEQPHDVISAYDFIIYDIEAIDRHWPIMHKAAALIGADPAVCLLVARFVADRLPNVWALPAWNRHPPVTSAVILADRSHDLVGLFSVGLKPNGSSDPFALRRAANHWLMQVVCSATAGAR